MNELSAELSGCYTPFKGFVGRRAVRCSKCRSDNPAGKKFCAACGTALIVLCAKCASENSASSQFCGDCGGALSVSTVASSKEALVGQEVSDGERRQLTVMFCDLVDSTALSGQLDPEELREVIRTYQAASVEIVERLGGYTAQYVGDGLLIYFGYPFAHEDDPQRALQAALEITAELPPLNARLRNRLEVMREHSLQVRIGIHTGLVVVGEMGAGAHLDPTAIVGETPNIAARLQTLAPPDSAAISSTTHKLVHGLFVCASMGPQILKGIAKPIEVYRVLGASGAHSRFEVVTRAGLIPRVDREEEMALLGRCWERTKEGQGQVVLLSGEPGIGKSRLVQEIKEQVVREGCIQAEFRASPYHENTAYYPIIVHLQRLLDLQTSDLPHQKLDKLERKLSEYGFALPEALPPFSALLSLPEPAGYPSLVNSPQRLRQKMLDLLMVWLLKESERRPVLTVWEDLHWYDPSTLEAYHLLGDQVAKARIFVLATARPEYVSQWGTRPRYTQLTLGRLQHRQAELMASEVAGQSSLPTDIMQQIVSKTDGVPLFVEELVKMVMESGVLEERRGKYELSSLLPPLAIPSTLRDSLTARLDRLSAVKEVVQLAATLGREFSYELIRAVWPLDEMALQKGLTAMVEAELLYQSGVASQAKYYFKHSLIQEAAYESVLRSRRQQLHLQIVRALEEKFPSIVETEPELLARHCMAANMKEKAIVYWQRAGSMAVRRSANKEAISHLTTGLELLKSLPDGAERAQQELTILATLGAALIATKGYSAPEFEGTITRARELCRQLGETPQLFPVMFKLCAYSLLRGEMKTAREIGEQMLHLAKTAQDPDLLLEASTGLGSALFYLGELVPALEHFEKINEIYDPKQHSSHAFVYGQDPGVFALAWGARVLGYLGYLKQAVTKVEQALTLAQNLAHPFSLASAWHCAAEVHRQRGEAQASLECAERELELAREQGFPLWIALAQIYRGWALARLGQFEEALATIPKGIAGYRATGAEMAVPRFLVLLADAYGQAGQVDEGLRVSAEALAIMHRDGDRDSEATELHRIRGELLLAGSTDHQDEAEASLRRAVDIARGHQAKSPELRATMSLVRLLEKRGDRREARAMLAAIYGWFTEGFDTADLREGKALLDELSVNGGEC
jgi:class 3 adenylate cyclase/predicted ATPase